MVRACWSVHVESAWEIDYAFACERKPLVFSIDRSRLEASPAIQGACNGNVLVLTVCTLSETSVNIFVLTSLPTSALIGISNFLGHAHQPTLKTTSLGILLFVVASRLALWQSVDNIDIEISSSGSQSECIFSW